MSECKVDCDRMRVLSSDLVNVSNSVGNVLSELSGMNLDGFTGGTNLQPHLRTVCSNVSTIQNHLYRYGESLGNISDFYFKAEKGLDGKPVKQGPMQQPYRRAAPGAADTVDKTAVKIRKNPDKQYVTWKDFLLNAGLDSVQNILEKGNWPVLMNLFKRGIIKSADSFWNIRNGIMGTAKFGLPMIGTVIDIYSMRKSGEGWGDTLVKGGIHLGVGLAGGKIGAAIGGAVGSIIPGAGTVAGTVIGAGIGIACGAVFTTVVNGAADFVYDNYAHKAARGFVHGVKKAGNTVLNAGKNVVNNLFRPVRATPGWISSILG